MKSRILGAKRVLAVKMSKGEEIVETLANACEENGIKSGVVWGIGAVREIELIGGKSTEKIDANQVKYEGPIEIGCATGSVCQKEGKAYVHLHAACGKTNHETISGHVVSAVVSLAGEFFVLETDEFEREYTEELKMWTMKV